MIIGRNDKNMRTDIFPLDYFTSIFTPKKAFRKRHILSWPKIIIVLVFLNALLTIPVTLFFANDDTTTVDQFYPEAFELIDDEVADTLRTIPVNNGFLDIEESSIQNKNQGIVVFGSETDTEENVVLTFEEDHFSMEEHSQPLLSVNYTTDLSFGEFTVDEVRTELNRQWRVNNQVYIVASFTFIVSAIMFVMLSSLVFGSAVFLYLTKKSQLTSISTYKESVAIILNGIALSTLAALLFGLIRFNIIWMLTIQTMGLVIMLVLMYFKTQFNDSEDKTDAQE